MRFDIITIFPDFFRSVFDHGILRRAHASGIVKLETHDLRAFTKDRHRTVDDRPFGGGEGMVLKPEPIFAAAQALGVTPKRDRNSKKETVVLLSAQGRPFTQPIAYELAETERVVMICGRYEGVDERVNDLLCDREISIGDYVLSGGELAAAVVVDATVRLLPGALGHPDSSKFESFSTQEPDHELDDSGAPRTTSSIGGLLDYPHYTRPAVFEGISIPDVLQGGNHEAVRLWRKRMALRKTLLNRPDLIARASLSQEDVKMIDELREEAQDMGS